MTDRPPQKQLPDHIAASLRSAFLCEFATVSAAAVPIDTPVGCFWNRDGTISVTTGLAYPAKAERARRNPKVGLLIEGLPDEPLILIAGLATVRDADIQANIDRYLPEISAYWESFSAGYPWSVLREGVHYWSRVIIDVTPVRIWWWDKGSTDSPPNSWSAGASIAAPPSDPAPGAAASRPIEWPGLPWTEQAEQMMAEALPAHLTLLDEAGYPLPFRARSVARTETGFALELPEDIPLVLDGKATLCFAGRSTFVGTVGRVPAGVTMHVERALPSLPTVRDLDALWSPGSETRAKLMARLVEELDRRGQALPVLPENPPPPSECALLRAQRSSRVSAALSTEGIDEKGAHYVR